MLSDNYIISLVKLKSRDDLNDYKYNKMRQATFINVYIC